MSRGTLLAGVMAGLFILALVACRPTQFTARLAPQVFSISVVPPAGGDMHTIEQGGTLAVVVNFTMGVDVHGNDVEVFLAEEDLPDGVTLAPGEIGLQSIVGLAAEETHAFTFNLVAGPAATPGTYQVPVEGEAEITATNADPDSAFYDTETTTFTLIVLAPGAGGGPTGPTAASSCEQFVNHYNSLACTTETLTDEGSCSESISEFCQNEDAFNACRIENTFCEGNELIENVAGCFELCN